MFRIPRYAIFIFVGLSVLTAFGIHEWIQQSQVEARVPAAQGMPSQSKSAWSLISQIFGWNTENEDIHFQYENERQCSDSRNYLSSMLNATPALFRDERVRVNADFPKECVLYSMKTFQSGSEQKPTSAFRNSSVKACVTKTYVNVVYNYVSDFSDCFGFSQRSLVPRFLVESGFHINAQSEQGGVGLAQVKIASVQKANSRFSEFQDFVKQSTKESCQRLSGAVDQLKPLSFATKSKIEDREALQNPLLNLFYFSIVESQNRDQLLSFINGSNPKYEIFKKMEALGLSTDEFDPERLLEILQILSYNLGPSSALVHFSNYLEQFPVKTHALTKEDLSISSKRDILSFPDYLRQFQLSGSSDYLNQVFEKAAELNTQFKEGTCAPEMFLSL